MTQGTLNGYDFKLFGLRIQSGIGDFVILIPSRKESVNHDWPEEDGINIDLADPHFSAREFRLSVHMSASSRADFKTKMDALFTQLKQEGTIELYFTDLDASYHVYFKEQQNLKKYNHSMNTNKVVITFDLVFGETDPTENFEDVYIITDQDEFIIA